SAGPVGRRGGQPARRRGRRPDHRPDGWSPEPRLARHRREQRTDPLGDPRRAPGGQGRPSVTPSAARRLARFVVALEPNDVPGCSLAAARYDFGRAARATAERLGGKPESTVVGSAIRAAAANAVLANATLAHGLDFDDTREDAIVHTRCVAVPTSLAVGEATGASGDVSRRARRPRQVPCAALPSDRSRRRVRRRGAAGKLYRLTEDGLVRAFGICGSQAAGIIEYLADGSWTKRLHPGWAAHGGVIAALLAQSGFTGPETVFEGEHGFYRAFAGEVEPERLDGLLASLGRVWELDQLTFKPYPWARSPSPTWTARCGCARRAACGPRTSPSSGKH